MFSQVTPPQHGCSPRWCSISRRATEENTMSTARIARAFARGSAGLVVAGVLAGLSAGTAAAATPVPIPANAAAVAPVSGLPYGPDTCKQGFVWREAIPSDHVCVTPGTRQTTAEENARAASLRDPNGAYGSNSCKQGYVWREAFDGDAVCVTPDRRAQAKADNAAAAKRLASSAPAPAPAPAPDKCKPWDGTATTGNSLSNTSPKRWFSGGSPELGVRWAPCDKTVTVYFRGGVGKVTHYNLRVNGSQREVTTRNTGVQVSTLVMPDSEFAEGYSSFTIQACERGGLFERSKCTSFSPDVKVGVHLGSISQG
jgi:hypothetical protein